VMVEALMAHTARKAGDGALRNPAYPNARPT